MVRGMFALFVLSACTLSAPAQDEAATPLDWLTGCWQNDTGDIREIWSVPEGGYYFGYAVSLKAGAVGFFEQMRIEPGASPTFYAYPAGNGPSAFPAIEQTSDRITFANPEHDYPQKIAYWRDGDLLKARISKLDDTSQGEFSYERCPQA
ncbi:MAG: DUF6265 family protein [Pseudomonadota bacterium]